ncbi:LuxR C-terminal-related transcriptional regulator [Streptomyces sp. NPDC001595]|uniref:response regulator transcription factor n=1 Tax=Streptomyces sp. NPDC001532 TaxID=3154520 RepID=UPI003321AFA5
MTNQQVAEAHPASDLVRTVIIHDDPLQRAGIRSLAQASSVIDVVGDYGSVHAFTGGVRRPDVLLVGARQLPDRPEAVVPAAGRTGEGRSPAVVVVMRPDDTRALRSAVMQTVHGYVDPCTGEQDIGVAVLAASRGRTFLSSSIAEVLVGWAASRLTRQRVSPSEALEELTAREREVLVALGEGITNAQIARRLYIQEATVRSHVYHILTKLGLGTRTEAVLLGHGLGPDWR